MASISVVGFTVTEDSRWVTALNNPAIRLRYFLVSPPVQKGRRDYILTIEENGTYEVLRRFDGKRDDGTRWPSVSSKKMAFAILLAVWKEKGNPWEP